MQEAAIRLQAAIRKYDLVLSRARNKGTYILI